MSGSIFVDDTSPLISYQGSWGDSYNPKLDTLDGGPFNGTLHSLFGSGSFTTFITGYDIAVVSSFDSESTTQPSWTCFIDGNVLGQSGLSGLINNAYICPFYNFHNTPPTKPYNLTVVASVTGNGSFLFDCIIYLPEASAPWILDNATVMVGSLSDQIQYSSGWTTYSTAGIHATSENSSLTFDFVGIQITWMTNGSVTNVTSSAQYSIDNGILVPFMVAPSSNPPVSFRSPVLSPGPHRLFVQYSGGMPLILDYFLIQNLTIPSFPPSPPIPTTNSPVSGKLSLAAGALSGIVIGSLVSGALVVIGLIWVIRFVKRKSAADSLRRQPAWYNLKAYGAGQDTQ